MSTYRSRKSTRKRLWGLVETQGRIDALGEAIQALDELDRIDDALGVEQRKTDALEAENYGLLATWHRGPIDAVREAMSTKLTCGPKK